MPRKTRRRCGAVGRCSLQIASLHTYRLLYIKIPLLVSTQVRGFKLMVVCLKNIYYIIKRVG